MSVNPAQIYKFFDPAPLKASDQNACYVELGAVRGEKPKQKIADKLAQPIRLSNQPTCQLITGHRGSGKSTELFRLQRELGEGPKRFFVVYCDVDESLNRSDMDFTDLLLAVVRQVAEQVKNKTGITLKAGYFEDRFKELGEFLGSPVDFSTVELGVGLSKIVGSIRSSGANRKTIRGVMEPKVDSLINAANDVIQEAKEQLSQKGFAGLVIVIDNLDHLVRRTGEGGEDYPGENLFIRRAPEMLRFDCHVVYTIPLALAFSPYEQELTRLYGNKTPIVGLTKLRDRAGQPYEPGIACFREVIKKRLDAAQARQSDVFASDAVRDRLIAMTGGQLAVLCTLVRSALVAGLPIQSDVLEELQREEQRAFSRWLKRSHWRMIDAVRLGNQPIPDDENAQTLRDVIESRGLLYHINADEWWAVNPLVGPTPPGI
jgi:hypothetical protein